MTTAISAFTQFELEEFAISNGGRTALAEKRTKLNQFVAMATSVEIKGDEVR